MKPHHRKRNQINPRLLDQRIQQSNAAARQSTFLPGKVYSHQHRLDRWDEGVAELDAKLEQQKLVKHYYVPLGALPSCEVCGGTFNELRQDGDRVHFIVPCPVARTV